MFLKFDNVFAGAVKGIIALYRCDNNREKRGWRYKEYKPSEASNLYKALRTDRKIGSDENMTYGELEGIRTLTIGSCTRPPAKILNMINLYYNYKFV
jgi:hypothetical protein